MNVASCLMLSNVTMESRRVCPELISIPLPLSFPARAHPWPLTHPCARPRHSRTPPSVMNIDRFRDRLFTKGRKIEGIVWLLHERTRRLRMLHLKTLNTLGKGYSLWEELIYTGNEHEDLNLC